ncbi:hypothetical protein JDV02_008780 [Purpureocillium takamizusanense]|uniref:Uncharacterized protein n=1 Tax=Purpureocillium takamizusanense TaxID=2060973 RepID=A0A9Q8QQD2_9HYPO|nr:uncharacterized protein JDV02_008780 [Purpureocillium takamizusanense]UNI22936.1 hypothetical protein JDV02_008780 [Purpureocillium takamizusanense]
MYFTSLFTGAILVAGCLAAPRAAENANVAKSVEMSPREYWAFAIKLRDDDPDKIKRDAGADLAAREYWAFAIKLRDGVPAKRQVLDSRCEQAEEGIYCTYTSADIEAYGTGPRLQDGCVTTDTGVSCFYPNHNLG